MRFVGQFQNIRRKRRYKEFGYLNVCLSNIICNGTVVETYAEIERPHDMWKLGRIEHNTWLQWDADYLDDYPRNMTILQGQQPDLEQIVETTSPDAKGYGVTDMFLEGAGNPSPSHERVFYKSDGVSGVNDMFLKVK